MRTILLFVLTIVLGITNLKAQISFPESNVLNLNTNVDVLYYETRIIFNTGKYKSNDYMWEKISDSLDKKWFFTSCFNGDCKIELLQSGQFITDFGIDDTTCFIALHVLTYGFNGKSVIKYRVYNKSDNSDKADLIYNISYTNLSSAQSESFNAIKVTNPASHQIILHNVSSNLEQLSLYDMAGKKLCNWENPIINNNTLMVDIPKELQGLFILNLSQNGNLMHRKILIK